MKKSFLLLAIFLTSSLSHASLDVATSRSNGLLRFIAKTESLREFALGSLIKMRCTRYMPPGEKAQCRGAVQKMLQILDFDIEFLNDDAFVFVAFKTNLTALLSKSKTETYLNDLNQELYRYLTERTSRPNIWDFTRKYYDTDYAAAMIIATLFQDTSMMKLHLNYLNYTNVRGNSRFESNKELLSRVIDTINLILDSSEAEYRSLFYPKDVQANLNRNIYHFYVPLYLAKALKVNGIKEKFAFSAAFMLTLTYEFVTASQDFRYLYVDPMQITNEYKLKDIFGGYAGATFGVREMNMFKTFSTLEYAFGRSTDDAVRLLLKD